MASKAETERIEQIGDNLSNGFGLWGTIDHLGAIQGYTPKKRQAVVRGWIDAGKELGLTEIDIAAIGDYRGGRHFVDSASFWVNDSPETILRKAKKAALETMRYEAKEAGGIPELKRQLVLNYTDYYPISYSRRLGSQIKRE